ncbi:MAG: polyprenyl synthetase family protein, partial [Nitrosopumilaceae archaeon]
MLARLEGNPKELYRAASHLIEYGGKRLRPYMVIKSCEILGGTIKQAMPAAAAVEMIHNFTLVHDDIMDND